MPTGIEEIMKAELIANAVRKKTKTNVEDELPLRISQTKLKSVFALFDADDTGFVQVADTDLLLRSLGIEVDDHTLDQIINDNPTEDGRFTYEQFLGILKTVGQPRDGDEEIKRMFALMGNEDASAVTAESLKAALASSEARITAEEIDEVLKYCDVDGDGKVSQEDWIEVLQFVNELAL